MLHGSRLPSIIDEIERTSDDVLVPLTGTTLRSALEVPRAVHGVELIGPGLAFSTFKESEDGEGFVLRCINLRDDEATGQWRLPFDARSAHLARLDETVISGLVVANREVAFRAPPRGIVTILVR